jgi:hypothetical protein
MFLEKLASIISCTDGFSDVHNSETYKKADQSVEKAAKKLFRKAGKLWGKSERYFGKKAGEENRKTDDG